MPIAFMNSWQKIILDEIAVVIMAGFIIIYNIIIIGIQRQSELCLALQMVR